MTFDIAALWTGRIILLVAGWCLIVFLIAQAIEWTLRVTRLNLTIIRWYIDTRQPGHENLELREKD